MKTIKLNQILKKKQFENLKIIKILTGGHLSANSYLVISNTVNAVMIDCQYGDEKLLQEIEKNKVKLTKILVTHGHCDNIESLAYIAGITGADVYIHELDAPELTDSCSNLSDYFSKYLDDPVKHYDKVIKTKDGDIIKQDELKFKVMHTPWHTSGCVCYIINDFMINGDTLFKNYVGRTDMLDGNYDALKESFPGNLNKTALNNEKRSNRISLTNDKKLFDF